MKRWLPFSLVPLALGLTALYAADSTLQLDPAQTEVHFTLPSTLHTVHGTFKLKKGAIHFDPATGEASGSIVIDATSGESGNGSRDERMHKSILESGKYTEITFSARKFTGTLAPEGDSQVDVQGVFNLHGADHDMTLTVKVHRTGDQLTATTHLVIPYVKWGLKNPSTFVLRVNDKVELDIHASGRVGTT
ncbi:MAG TPA: YceI family protein [Bryobacteraceae bacterium]|nr:YceI family protein [Bryobacteraceae bacterium]